MDNLFGPGKTENKLRTYARFFALGTRDEHTPVSAGSGIKKISALKAGSFIVKKAMQSVKQSSFPVAFKKLDEGEEEGKLLSFRALKNVHVLQHYKGKTLQQTLFQFPESDIQLYFLHPGRPPRHIDNTGDLDFAMNDFLKMKNDIVGKEVHAHVAEAFAGLFNNDDRAILQGVHDIWEVASFSEGYKLVSQGALKQLSALLEHRHLEVQCAVLAAFWSLAFHHRLSMDFVKSHVLPRILDKKQKHRFSTYNKSNEGIFTFHVRVFGLLACLVCEGGAKQGNVLGTDGVDLLINFVQYPSSPKAHQLGFMALLDAILGSREACLHIVENQELVKILTHSLREVHDATSMIEDIEILCALSRVEGSHGSHLHSAGALGDVVAVIKQFHEKGVKVMKEIDQEKWETIILHAIATLWGIVSGEHGPSPALETTELVVQIAMEMADGHGSHEAEMLICCFGLLSVVIHKPHTLSGILQSEKTYDFFLRCTLHKDVGVRVKAATALKFLVLDDPAHANSVGCWKKILESEKQNYKTHEVSFPLLQALEYLSDLYVVRSKESIVDLSQLLLFHSPDEVEIHLAVLWKLALVPENRYTLARDEITFKNLLAVTEKFSANVDYVHIVYSAICSFWALTGDNKENNYHCINHGWVDFLVSYLARSQEYVLDTPEETVERLASACEKPAKNATNNMLSPRTISIKSESILPPKFNLPQLRHNTTASQLDIRCDAWTVGICALWTLLDHEDAIEIMLKTGLSGVLLNLIIENGLRIPSLLRIRASGMLLDMLLHREHTKEAFAKLYPKNIAERLIVTMLYFRDIDTQCYGAISAVRRATGEHRISLVKLGAVEKLMELLSGAEADSSLAEYCSQGLLNLSTHPTVQQYIPKVLEGSGFRTVLQLATKEGRTKMYPSQVFAAGILTNLMRHKANRTTMYKVELQKRTEELYGELIVDPDQYVRPQSHKVTSKSPKKRGFQTNDPRTSFLLWISNLMDGGSISKSDGVREPVPAPPFNAEKDAEGLRDSLQPAKALTRSMSPRRRYANAKPGFGKPTFANGPKTLRGNMCKPATEIWRDSHAIEAKNFAVSVYNQDNPPTIKRALEGGLSCLLSDLNVSAPNRWEPSIVKLDWGKAVDKHSSVRVTHSGKITSKFNIVLDPPESPRSHIKFNPVSTAVPGRQARLSAWPHISGARAGQGIFTSFEMPDGQVMYFYENDRLQEAHVPQEVSPVVPSDPSQFGSPVFVEPGPPANFSHNDPPKIRSLPAPKPPMAPPTKLDEVLERSSNKMICFGYGNKQHIEIHIRRRKSSVDPNAWNLDKSIFAARPFDNDSKTYWDDGITEQLAFDVDWQRCIDKASFRSFLSKLPHTVHPFEIGDMVEVLEELSTNRIAQGTIRVVHHSGHVSVKLEQGNYLESICLSRVRFVHGDWGGDGGKNPRISNHDDIEELERTVPAALVGDIIGLKGAGKHRLEHFSLCKFTFPDHESIEAANEGEHLPIKIKGNRAKISHAVDLLNEAEDIAGIKHTMSRHVETAYRAFAYFGSISGPPGHLLDNQFYDFIHLCHINNEASTSCNNHKIIEIVTKTLSVEKRHHSAEGFNSGIRKMLEKSSKNKFRRFEYIEVLVRLAHAKYHKETESVPDCIDRLFKRNIEKHILEEASRSHNRFRDERLYMESVDKVLRHNFTKIARLFCLFGGEQTQNRNSLYMTSDQFLGVMQSCSLINHEFNRRSAKNCAIWSMNLVIDDIKNYHRANAMTFTDFLECLCRCAEMYDIPSKSEIKRAGSKTIVEYFSSHRLKKQDTHKMIKQVTLSRIEQIKQTLAHGESSRSLINGVNMERSGDDFHERVELFLDLLFHFAYCRLDSFRNYVGTHDWKLKKIIMQYKKRHFEVRRDNRFTKRALKISKKHPVFHGGKPKFPELIAYNEEFLEMHNLPN